MQQIVNINGFETVIEIPEGQEQSPLKYDGNKDSYHISYGNGLEEVGGVAEVTFADNTEATADVALPFTTLLDCQCTAIDVVGELQETTHIELVEEDKKLRLYGKVHPAYTGKMKIKWNAKGVI